MGLVTNLLVILLLIFVWLSTPVFVEDNVIEVKNLTYSSNCWLDFKYYNISCSYIDISINESTVGDGNRFDPPIIEFTMSEGFKVDGCQTVLVRCYKDGIETHYIAQGTEDAKSNNVKEEGGDGNGYWIIGVVLGILTFALICFFLRLAVCYRMGRCRDKHHLPFCCESRMKDPIEDPTVIKSLCERSRSS